MSSHTTRMCSRWGMDGGQSAVSSPGGLSGQRRPAVPSSVQALNGPGLGRCGRGRRVRAGRAPPCSIPGFVWVADAAAPGSGMRAERRSLPARPLRPGSAAFASRTGPGARAAGGFIPRCMAVRIMRPPPTPSAFVSACPCLSACRPRFPRRDIQAGRGWGKCKGEGVRDTFYWGYGRRR